MTDAQITPKTRRQVIQANAEWTLIVVFLIGLFLPFGEFISKRHNVIKTINDAFEIEGDSTKEWSLSFANVGSHIWKLPRNAQNSLDYRFGYRTQLITLNSLAKYFCLGESPHAHVIVGKEGWHYLAWLENGIDARKPTPFTQEEMSRWHDVLEARADWLKQRNCHYLFVIAPEKQTVYSECLPDAIPAHPCTHDRTIQLMEYLNAKTVDYVFDLTEVLKGCKKETRLYHKTDSHWNEQGAFMAYSALVHRMSQFFPGMSPIPESGIHRFTNVVGGLDLGRMMGIERYLREDSLDIRILDRQAQGVDEKLEMTEEHRIFVFRPAVYENQNRKLPKVVLIGDSFSFALHSLLAEHFSRLVYLPAHVLDPQVIEREKPDIVIQEIVERKLFVLSPDDPVMKDRYQALPELADEGHRQFR